MKISVAFSWVCLAVVLVLLASIGCGGSLATDSPAAETPSISDSLPALPIEDERSARALGADTLLGKDAIDWSATGAQPMPPSDDFEFTTGQDMAYGLWQFPGMADVLFLNLTTTVSFGGGSEYYVAVSNYSLNQWDIDGPFTSDATVIFTPGMNYTSGADNFYVAVLAANFSVGLVHDLSVNYDDNPGTYSISGHITDPGGSPIEGIQMRTIPGDANMPVTDAEGFYIFNNFGPSVVEVKPFTPEYTYAPPSIEVSIFNEDVTGVDFVASTGSLTHAVSGTILDGALDPIAAVVVTAMPGSVIAVTDAAGIFEFPTLEDDTYTLTPALAEHTFDPTSQEVIVSGSDVTGVDFTGTNVGPPTFSISGSILDGTSSPIPGTGVSIDPGGHIGAADGSGNYSVGGLIAGEYIVYPTGAGYSFTPTQISVDIVDADATGKDFTGEVSTTPTYDVEIRPILLGCAGCHTSLHSIPLNNYTNAAANAQTVWNFASTDPTHNFMLPWDQPTKDTFKDWLDGGTPES